MTSGLAGPSGRRSGLRRSLARIRVRIVAGYLLLLLAALAVTILWTRRVQLARVDREIAQQQAQEVDELRLLAGGVDPETGQLFGADAGRIIDVFLSRNVPSDDEGLYALVDGQEPQASRGSPDLFEDPQFLAAWSAVDRPTQLETSTDVPGAGEVRSLAVPIRVGDEVNGVFVVASFPDDDQREVDEVVLVISIAGLAMLVLTTAVAWSIAGRILRPVRDLSAAARSVTESDLSARIPVDGHDELADLGTTFNEMLDRLEAGFEHQRRFLNDVAHELRTPITIARGHLEFVGDDPTERAETIEIVTDELDRMSRYVSDLLTIAKAEQPDFLDERPVDVGDLVAEAHQRAQALGRRTWVLDAAPPPGVLAITADPERLRQALMNLAGNAVQHTDEDGEIGLGATAANGELRLWVRDTGPGVEPDVAATVFDRFARGATSRSTRPEGAGIGLSIVAAIARAHGGRVDLDTSPAGATFTLCLPFVTFPGWAGGGAAGSAATLPPPVGSPSPTPTPTEAR